MKTLNFPAQMAFDPDKGYLYVSNYHKGTIQVFDTATKKQVGSISVSSDGPYGLAFNPNNHEMYVAMSKRVCEKGPSDSRLSKITPLTGWTDLLMIRDSSYFSH